MRICMLSELFYPYLLGGAERRFWEIARRLAAKGHDVTVYSLKFPGHRNEEMVEGVRIKRVGWEHPLFGRAPRKLPSYIPALFKSLSYEYDIIDANQGIAFFAGLWKAFGARKPVVATFHDVYWGAWKEHFRWPGTWLGAVMEALWVRFPYTKIITNSGQTASKLRRMGCTRPIESIVSGVDLDFIGQVPAADISKTIAYVGRLEGYKNIDILMRAMASSPKLKKYTLQIIGQGTEEKRLRRLAGDLKIKAQFAGYVAEDRKIALIKASDVLVNPSGLEGLGLILLEGMACGTPVVGLDLECYREFCTPSNSILVENPSHQEFAAAMERVLTNTAFNKKLRKNGLETAQKFSWDAVADRTEKIYESLVDKL